jgi:hypothetical protein
MLFNFTPSLEYGNADKSYTVEWHIEGGEECWKQIQGNPGYQGCAGSQNTAW